MAEKLIIFISGTMRDLPTERGRVAATIRDMGLELVWAEKRGATDRPSRDECKRMAWDEAMEAQVRGQAAKVLWWLGQASPEVLAGLWAPAEEPETPESVRRAAREALEWLEG